MPADVLVAELCEDSSFALRRLAGARSGVARALALVTQTALTATPARARSCVEEEEEELLVLGRRAGGLASQPTSLVVLCAVLLDERHAS